MRPYFAYGSNLWDLQMAARCPEHRKLGRAVLAGYRWIITTRGYASVVEAPGGRVEGVVFGISATDEESLDLHEGVAKGNYVKTGLWVTLEAGGEVMALVYVDPVTEEGEPKVEYIARINAGLEDAGLSADYVARVVRRFVPANDKNKNTR